MGDILFIRVSAVTTSEEDVKRRWPRLYSLIFGSEGALSKMPEKDFSFKNQHGVIELSKHLADAIKYQIVSKDICSKLESYSDKIYSLCKLMDDYLADADIANAKKLTYTFEELLDSIEYNID